MKASAFKKIYASLIIAILFIENANSQIIYTNVNPDQTCTSLCSYSIDLNNDGIIDFTLHHVVSNGPCLCGGYAVSNSVYITLNSGNAVVSNGSPLALNFGYPIDNSNTFSTSINQTLAGTGQSCIGGCHGVPRGIWSGVTNHYLGLRLQIGSNSFYGWAKLDVGSSGSNFTIKEYAYNSTPNQSILAGQTTCALPTVNVTASGATTFCYGSSLTLTADSASGYTFQWQKNAVDISAAPTRSYKVTTSGNYSVVTTNTCGTSTSTPLSCTRIYNPTPVISTTDPLTYCAGQAINTMFTANTYAGVIYQWQKNSVDISGAIVQNYTAAATGKYRVRETANGCSRTSSAKSIIINCRIQGDVAVPSFLSIYPNPASNSITIQFPSEEEGTIQIVNLFGQIVFSEKVVTDEMKIDVSRFQEGMYVARWNSNKYPQSKILSVTK